MSTPDALPPPSSQMASMPTGFFDSPFGEDCTFNDVYGTGLPFNDGHVTETPVNNDHDTEMPDAFDWRHGLEGVHGLPEPDPYKTEQGPEPESSSSQLLVRSTPPVRSDLTFDESYDVYEDNEEVDGHREEAPINIFENGASLFGGGEFESEQIPQTPPFAPGEDMRDDGGEQLGGDDTLHPPARSPAAQTHISLSSHHYSSEDSDDNAHASHGEAFRGGRVDKEPVGAHVDDRIPSPPRAIDPTLDPTLGTQVESHKDYEGSIEDNDSESRESSPGPRFQRSRRGARSRSQSCSGSETSSESGGVSKWDLRHRPDAVMTTHLDWDESGNYDPTAERRRVKKPEAEKKRVVAPHPAREEFDENGQPVRKKPKISSPGRARQIGDCKVFVVTLKSEAGKDWLVKHQGEDNWPYDEGRKKKLRPRKRLIRYDSNSEDDLPPIPDPKKEQDDLRHHPAARGCVQCRMEGHKCSLRQNGATWPCINCIESFAGNDMIVCEMITPPEKKQACENCLDASHDCSYNGLDNDHTTACQKCLEEGQECYAGPELKTLPKRMTYTPPPGVKYTPYRPFVTCTACRQMKKACSLKAKTDQPPCRACEKAGIACTFEKVVPTNSGKQKASGPAGNESPAQPETPKVGRKSNNGSSSIGLPNKTKPTSGLANKVVPSEGVSGNGGSSSSSANKGKRPIEAPDGHMRDMITKITSGVPTASGTRAARRQKARAAQSGRRGFRRAQPKDSLRLINPHTAPSKGHSEFAPSAKGRRNPYKPETPPGTLELIDQKGRSGPVSDILTSYPHPIYFCGTADEPVTIGDEDGYGCTFCNDPLFGIFGLAWKKPGVIAWRNGQGYTELEGGHRALGAKPILMCMPCTMARVDILQCGDEQAEGHQMLPLLPIDTPAEYRDRLISEQIHRLVNKDDPKVAARLRKDKWCSVCPSPAAFSCRTEPQVSGNCGCGLHLCQSCEEDLRVAFRGQLQALIEAKLATERGVTECRADALFLLEDSVLVKSFMAQIDC